MLENPPSDLGCDEYAMYSSFNHHMLANVRRFNLRRPSRAFCIASGEILEDAAGAVGAPFFVCAAK